MENYYKLGIACFLPVLAAILFHIAEKYTRYKKLDPRLRQVITGIVFGALAVFGTEWGIPLNGAQVNCRDAAVLTAGIMFGAPAGIIAGVIGAVERWIAVAWGVGTFTRVACSLSTLIAGIYAAALRKLMFEDKRPGWLLSLAIGVVMEVFHLTMVFLTNMDTPIEAMAVVKACTIPMVAANGISVMLSGFFLAVLSFEPKSLSLEKIHISQMIQRWMTVAVILAFFATSFFVFRLQNTIAKTQADNLLDLALSETTEDILDTVNREILIRARSVRDEIKRGSLENAAGMYGAAEISVADDAGTITGSTVPEQTGRKFILYDPKTMTVTLDEDVSEYVCDSTTKSGEILKYSVIRTETGFIQIGYETDDFQKFSAEDMVWITKNRHVGKTGYILLLDEDLEAVSVPDGFDLKKVSEETKGIEVPDPDTTFSAPIGGEDCLCRYREAEGYAIISVLPQTEAYQMRNIALYVNTFMEILVFAVLFGLIYLLIKRVVVVQIKKINGSLTKITAGDLEETVNVRTNEEFALLSDDINSTVDTLKRYISEASARIDKELEFCKAIQRSALPSVFPAFPKHGEFDIYAIMDPAKEVGGDFYDFYMTHDDMLHFLVADVSGKGIPAAMFMMRAKTELKSLTDADVPIDEVFTNGNNALCEGNDAGMFVTSWQGGLDLETGKVSFVNAGHNPPLIRHADGTFEFFRSKAEFVLGGIEDFVYHPAEITLLPGEIIFLYTDGVTEAQNITGELFGEERLLEAANSLTYTDMKEFCEGIKHAVDAFVGEAEQFDDITMVALRYFGSKEKKQ